MRRHVAPVNSGLLPALGLERKGELFKLFLDYHLIVRLAAVARQFIRKLEAEVEADSCSSGANNDSSGGGHQPAGRRDYQSVMAKLGKCQDGRAT